jgi:hypothetical protein
MRMPASTGTRYFVMATGGDALPVLAIDGANFSDLDGFACEFSGLLCH